MILPIIAFGASILRKKCVDVSLDFPSLNSLIENMWETMYSASGVGLAAPQINKNLRLFIIDTTPFTEDEEVNEDPVKKVFINARIIEETGESWSFSEGCLSIPELREDINRKSTIKIQYMDENFINYTEVFGGLAARVIQHEYDHIEGVLFVDKVSQLRKRMIKGKLLDISKGKVTANYKMKFIK